MARSIWSGVISFGLVSVPVAMYPATREHEVSFHQFEKGTGDRIRYQRINERTGQEVDYEDIVKGANVGGGDYVMLEPEELDEVAPGRSRSLEIHQFVDLGEIDPVYFQKTYYLGPGGEETTKAYVLLRDSLAEADLAAIGTLVMRGKEYLAAIRADGPLLVLETMFFADEVRDPKEVVDPMPGRVKARPQELRMAGQLIESMTAKWVPSDFRDSYTDRVRDLIAAKKAGDEVTAAEAAPEATDVTDLMEALRRSVEQTRQRRGTSGARKSTAKKATAKKATAKKTTAKKATKKATTAKKAGASRKAA
ncbi:MAG TPA: Ku protein [Candidatus Limnocylindrales bacterium]|nr:Ku protein [Candidatus Limnocylindrales bacterium]